MQFAAPRPVLRNPPQRGQLTPSADHEWRQRIQLEDRSWRCHSAGVRLWRGAGPSPQQRPTIEAVMCSAPDAAHDAARASRLRAVAAASAEGIFFGFPMERPSKRCAPTTVWRAEPFADRVHRPFRAPTSDAGSAKAPTASTSKSELRRESLDLQRRLEQQDAHLQHVRRTLAAMERQVCQLAHSQSSAANSSPMNR